MSIDYHFKPLGLPDLPQMMAIEREIFPFPSSASMMRDSLLAAHCQAWGLIHEQTGELLAYAVLSVILDEAEVINIGVAKAHHRQGYGEILLDFLLLKSKEAKADQIFLEVAISNQAAIALYEKFGFKHDRVRKDYYRTEAGPKEDALMMSLHF